MELIFPCDWFEVKLGPSTSQLIYMPASYSLQYKLAALARERACFITYQLASYNLQQQPVSISVCISNLDTNIYTYVF